MRFVERFFALVSLALLATVAAILAWWQFLDGPAVPATVEWSRLNKTTFLQGETMHIERKMCLNTTAGYTVHRWFQNGLIFQLSDFPSQVRDVGCGVRSIDIRIPDELPPGKYTYRVFGTWRINPLRTLRFDFPQLPEFTVVARDG